jgi:hypothetical protein
MGWVMISRFWPRVKGASMKERRQEVPFIVVGMGRSGTSYFGSILDEAGIGMGGNLKPPDEHNKRGYFEDLEATRMHQEWLERRGLTLASVSDSFPLPATPDEMGAISSYIALREAEGGRWGLKAPGILFFWDAWREQLPRGSVVLVPFRHPSAVADSFERYGLGRQQALALWLQLNRLALRAARVGPFETLFLDFDNRDRFARALSSVLGSYVDPYEPALRQERPHTEPLPSAFGELYAELVARASVRLPERSC